MGRSKRGVETNVPRHFVTFRPNCVPLALTIDDKASEGRNLTNERLFKEKMERIHRIVETR